MNKILSVFSKAILVAILFLSYSSCKKDKKEYTHPVQQERKLFNIICNGLWEDDSIVTRYSPDSMSTFKFEKDSSYLQYWEFLPSGTYQHVRVRTNVSPYKRHVTQRGSWLMGKEDTTGNILINSYVRNVAFKNGVLILSDIGGYQFWYYHDIKALVERK